MNDSASQLDYLRDARIAAHAVAATPAWLWSVDATQILWANAAGAAIFDAPAPALLASRRFDAADPAAPQIARIAAALRLDGVPRLERLSGFGTEASRTLTCGCSRLSLPDGTGAVLVVAAEIAGPALSLEERVQRLVAELDLPVAVFAADGMLFHANQAAAGRLAVAATVEALGADALATHALRAGYAAGGSTIGALSFDRIGDDAATFLIATLAATSRAVPPKEPSAEAPVTAAPSAPEADVFASEPAANDATSIDGAAEAAATPPPHAALSTASMPERRQPLRFVWQMDAEGRFTTESEDFIRLTGPRTAEVLGQPWGEIVRRLNIDPKGEVSQAVASRDTWSAITIEWPVDGTDERLSVELSGLPVFDRERHFGGYRGFGVCRDARGISIAASLRRHAPPQQPVPQTSAAENVAADEPAAGESRAEKPPGEERPILTIVPQAENVVPFRAANDKGPSLSPGERNAFHELAKELTSRLQRPKVAPDAPPQEQDAPSMRALHGNGHAADESNSGELTDVEPKREAVNLFAQPARDDRAILDRIPTSVLVYRLDMPVYANSAFLRWSGYESVIALATAGGLDELFVELGEKANADDGQPLRVTSNRGGQQPAEGRLFTAPWEGEPAHVLMLLPVAAEAKNLSASDVEQHAALDAAEAAMHTAEAALQGAEAERRELKAILDTVADGVLVLDLEGRILTANAGAEALFGRDGAALAAGGLDDVIAPESQRAARDYFNGMTRAGAAPKKGCEVIGRGRDDVRLPLFMTLGMPAEGKRLCAVFRDLTAWKKTETELVTARQQAERVSAAKSEFLAKISHEIRTPLNSIIGFSEVMMHERFGPLGNERYKQYLKDVHASGAHLVSLLNDLLDLSKIEAGKLDLSFGRVSLNDLTQQCVALMQPQATQERVIIRTSLPQVLPSVMADARSVRQIVLNLLSNSIKFTGAGGQVIVSTTHTDDGEVVLRVRDTGHGMTESEIQMALEPFRQLATSSRWGSGGSGLGLPLSKALAEANRANFSIKSAVNAGTLVEIAFPPGRVLVA